MKDTSVLLPFAVVFGCRGDVPNSAVLGLSLYVTSTMLNLRTLIYVQLGQTEHNSMAVTTTIMPLTVTGY